MVKIIQVTTIVYTSAVQEGRILSNNYIGRLCYNEKTIVLLLLCFVSKIDAEKRTLL